MKYGFIAPGSIAQVAHQKKMMKIFGIGEDFLIYDSMDQVFNKLSPDDVIHFTSLLTISSKVYEISDTIEKLWEKEINIQILDPEIWLSSASEAGNLLREMVAISRSDTSNRLTAARRKKQAEDPNFHTGPAPMMDMYEVAKYRESHTIADTARYFDISISTVKRYTRNAKAAKQENN